MRKPAAIVGAIALAASGCLIFTDISGLDTEDAVLDGGDSPASDSPSTVADAVGGDGTTDASGGGVVGCTGSDAGFCADFDDGVLVGRWTALETGGVGRTLEISNAVSKSPSSALHSVIDREAINPPPDDCIYARALRDLPELGARTRALFSFDAWLGAANGPAITKSILVGR
jgi:hypothetical protein